MTEPPAAHVPIPVIEAAAPGDGPVEGDFATSEYEADSNASTSVTSSIYKHSYENGRRYHTYRNGRYPIPNDDTEQNRDDMKHALMLELTDGKLFFAPVGDHPQKIIDLGTGTGAWAIDIGDQYPSAEVIGIDLSPIQPVWVPPNVRFLVDDAEDDWTHGENFDLVHTRHLCAILKDVKKVLRQAFKHTKPGGWLEVQEFAGYIYSDDDSVAKDSIIMRFFETMFEAMTKFGANFRIVNELGPILDEIGYVNAVCKTIKVPIGTWPKDKTLRLCGLYMQTIVGDLMTAFAAKPLLALGWEKEKADAFAAEARRYLKDTGTEHPYINFKFWTAQKLAGKGKELGA